MTSGKAGLIFDRKYVPLIILLYVSLPAPSRLTFGFKQLCRLQSADSSFPCGPARQVILQRFPSLSYKQFRVLPAFLQACRKARSREVAMKLSFLFATIKREW